MKHTLAVRMCSHGCSAAASAASLSSACGDARETDSIDKKGVKEKAGDEGKGDIVTGH